MHIIQGHHNVSQYDTPSAIAIGIFDGVHRGHQALLRQMLHIATNKNLAAMVYTFDPHPAYLFNPSNPPKLIEPLSMRLERFAKLGIHTTIVEPFTPRFAQTTAEDFVKNMLVDKLGVGDIIVGNGFVFGAAQQGSITLLQQLGKQHHFNVHPTTLVQDNAVTLSSTAVRKAVTQGDMAQATAILGRPFCLQSIVIHGDKRGRTLGFPTANLQVSNALLPKPGVYAGAADGVFGHEKAVINIGYTPTFKDTQQLKIEAHLIDYQGEEFYDSMVHLHVMQPLRNEMRFADIHALKQQIIIDIKQARGFLKV